MCALCGWWSHREKIRYFHEDGGAYFLEHRDRNILYRVRCWHLDGLYEGAAWWGGWEGILFSPPVSDHVAKTRAHNVHTEREGERGRGGDLATAQDQHILALSNVLLRNIASVFLEILQKMGQSWPLRLSLSGSDHVSVHVSLVRPCQCKSLSGTDRVNMHVSLVQTISVYMFLGYRPCTSCCFPKHAP